MANDGTCDRGYMAPEYALHGYLSIKTDVYGFGMLVVELIAGRRVSLLTGVCSGLENPYEFHEIVISRERILVTDHMILDLSFFTYLCWEISYGHEMKNEVERNWLQVTLSNVVDPTIDVDSSFMTRFLEIGLLCVQQDHADRPTMEEVVSMLLDSSSLTLPMAKMEERITRERSNSVSSSNTVDHSDPDYDYNTGPDEDFISELVPR
ncbi:cysteine-rich receptor-like protein kinase 8 [Helianthus annuus]|uniref:cysteine-rich receptor-like protein kinase 8 n=1 Tax=Helianthus annuus TaxID=4232 RepID=UPI000B8F95B3|nr:cysteine-rich receptor-like protein kinase 8 [Helianthus annuus]